jgi:hypothetical protein
VLALALLVVALRGGSYAPRERGEFFVVVLWVLVLCVALGLLPRYRVRTGGRVAVAALVGLAGWMALGLMWSESAERTVAEVARVVGFAGLLMLILWTFGGRGAELAVGALTATALSVCVLALVSRLAPDLIVSSLSESDVRRLAYPLNYWNALGAWSAMTTALTLALSAHARSGWLRGGALAGVSVAISVAYLTYSRSSAIGVVIAVLGVVALSRHRWQAASNAVLAAAGAAAIIATIRSHPEIAEGTGTDGAAEVVVVAGAVTAAAVLAAGAGITRRLSGVRLPRRAARAALVSTGVAALVALVAVGPALANRAWESFERREESRAIVDPAERLGNLSGVRNRLWAAALDSFDEHAWSGTGAGTYEFVWNRDPRRDSPARDAHSLYVEVLAETGVPGALLILLAVGALLVTALRAPLREKDAAAAGAAAGGAIALLIFCVTAGVDWMWEVTAVPALGLACGGLAAAIGTARAPALRIPARAGATFVASLLLAMQLPNLVSAMQIRDSRLAIRAGRIDAAAASATTAIDAQPWAASGYLQRALVLERARMLDDAADDARRAIEHEPTNWEPWLILARIDVERGRTSSGLRAARHARALNPHSPLFDPPAPPARP